MANDLEYAIRASLLDHYSSETRAHATYLLTLALIGVTVITAQLNRVILLVALSVVIAAFIRTVFRTVYWGSLERAILVVPKRVDRDAQKPWTEVFNEEAVRYVAKHHKRISLFGSYLDWFGILLIIFYWEVSFVPLFLGQNLLFAN